MIGPLVKKIWDTGLKGDLHTNFLKKDCWSSQDKLPMNEFWVQINDQFIYTVHLYQTAEYRLFEASAPGS